MLKWCLTSHGDRERRAPIVILTTSRITVVPKLFTSKGHFEVCCGTPAYKHHRSPIHLFWFLFSKRYLIPNLAYTSVANQLIVPLVVHWRQVENHWSFVALFWWYNAHPLFELLLRLCIQELNRCLVGGHVSVEKFAPRFQPVQKGRQGRALSLGFLNFSQLIWYTLSTERLETQSLCDSSKKTSPRNLRNLMRNIWNRETSFFSNKTSPTL